MKHNYCHMLILYRSKIHEGLLHGKSSPLNKYNINSNRWNRRHISAFSWIFISHLKQNVPGVLAIYCVIQRQRLVAKNLNCKLHRSLQLVTNAVNRIRSNALNTRLYAQLCDENHNSHRLLLHSELRWP